LLLEGESLPRTCPPLSLKFPLVPEIPGEIPGKATSDSLAMADSENEDSLPPLPLNNLDAANIEAVEVLLEGSDESTTLTQPDVSPSISSFTSNVSQPQSPVLQPMIQLQPLKTFSVSSRPDSATTQASAMFLKAQEHCRVAMSALNNNDVEQGRQAIRAALALLGDKKT
jgi:Vta1 C-terminal domain